MIKRVQRDDSTIHPSVFRVWYSRLGTDCAPPAPPPLPFFYLYPPGSFETCCFSAGWDTNDEWRVGSKVTVYRFRRLYLSLSLRNSHKP